MREPFTILIADRNRHVREFLKREMEAAGYKIRLAKTGREVLQFAYLQDPLDLIILDPDLPEAEELGLLAKLQDRIPNLPVVLHAFPFRNGNRPPDTLSTAIFVEKSGNSIEGLKEAVTHLLQNAVP